MADTNGHSDIESYERLRRSAKDLIDHGVPPPARGGNLNAEALQLLYERARSPDSAADALKLLHELQTYQVELDLLYEQLQANEQEINEELMYYRSLYEQAPVGYLVVTGDGQITEGNEAASVFFGQSPHALAGKKLSALLASGQGNTLATLLRKSREQAGKPESVVSGSLELPDNRLLTIRAKPSEGADSILMTVTEATHHAPGS